MYGIKKENRLSELSILYLSPNWYEEYFAGAILYLCENTYVFFVVSDDIYDAVSIILSLSILNKSSGISA
jgi:hypothetical protein